MKKVSIPLIFLSLLFCERTFSQNPGDSIFNSGQLIHEVRINFSFNSWYDTLTKYYSLSNTLDSNIYLMATSVVFDGVSYDSVGCKFKGNSSYNNPSQKKSWKLDFEEFKDNNEINGMKQLNLNNGFKDPSFLREKTCLDFLNHYYIPAPRCDYANVYVNNQLWSFYMLVEEIDKTFLKTHFDNKSGNLFKGDPHGDLKWKGSLASNYYGDYELKTNEDINDWSDLLWLIDNINNTPAAQYKDSLDASFNTTSYIKSWAGSILFSNLDSYTGSGHNYYIYHNVDSNKFEWINWDVNEAYGTFLNGNQLTGMTTLSMNYIPTQGNRPLNTKMIANTVYWSEYENFLCNVLTDYFNPTHMNPVFDSLHNQIATYVNADPRKFYGGTQFTDNLTSTQSNALGLKPFVQERYNYLTQQLSSFVCTPISTTIQDLAGEEFEIFPNPVGNELQVSGFRFQVSGLVEIFDVTGRKIFEERVSTSNFKLETSNYVPGIYLLKAGDAVKKFVKE